MASQQECGFCEIISVPAPPTPNDVYQRIGNVVLMPTVGMQMPGHMMLLTPEHTTSFSQLGRDGLEQTKETLDICLTQLAKSFNGPYFALEHGSDNIGSGGCVEHAHIHAIPDKDNLAEHIQSLIEWEQLDSYADLANYTGTPYVYLGRSDKHFIAPNPKLPSQWVRRQIAQVQGEPDDWDWALVNGSDNLCDTLLAVKNTLPYYRKPCDGPILDSLPETEDSRPTTGNEVGSVIRDWLWLEHHLSTTSRNRYLDNLGSAQDCLKLSYRDPSNFIARKALGHLDRLKHFKLALEAIYDDPEHTDRKIDEQEARLLFGLLMRASGCHLNQLIIQSNSQTNFNRRKAAESSGVDIIELAHRKLDDEPLWENSNLEDVYQSIDQASNLERLAMIELYDNHLAIKHLGQEQSPAVDLLKEVQTAWINSALQFIKHQAWTKKHRLLRVPFLEPKSISDNPEIFYPFSFYGNWMREFVTIY